MKIAATTISDAPGLIREKAKERAKALAIPYLEREDKLEEMAEKYKAEGFLIYGHPSSARARFLRGMRPAYAGCFQRKDPAASLTVPLAMRMIPRRFPGS